MINGFLDIDGGKTFHYISDLETQTILGGQEVMMSHGWPRRLLFILIMMLKVFSLSLGYFSLNFFTFLFVFTDENFADDIALIKFKPLDYSTWGRGKYDEKKINPVCLPESSFPDEDQIGFVIGLGLRYQPDCKTNGAGPEMYKQCAPGKMS